MAAGDSFPEDPPREGPNPGRRPHVEDPEDAVNPPQRIQCVINGRSLEVSAPPRRTLLQLLREDLSLTGTKEGCNIGTCGACTVLIDGRAVLSCLVLAVQANGRTIETIEAAAQDSAPLLEAFIQHDAFQCGFCTPGQIMALRDLFRRDPHASAGEIRRAVEGNVCRCGAHLRIQAAALAVAGPAGGRKEG
jgi:aerobic-type carbon monoxide dehydrogenase small subunit (CoxS/CutS family)